MSVTYNTNVINSRLTVVLNALDAGSSHSVLRIATAGFGTILSSIQLGKPTGTVAGGYLTFSVPYADPLIAASGFASVARLEDSNGTVVATNLTVGTSTNSDVVISTTLLTSGNSLALISGSIQGN